MQVIDDLAGTTLAAASSVEPAVKAKMTDGARAGNNKGAGVVGEAIAERLKAKGISQGRLRSERVPVPRPGSSEVAEAARKAGLEF